MVSLNCNRMTLEDFKPHDSTGPEPSDMLFRWYLTGPQGARYELFKETSHSEDDVNRAKRYIRRNFDVVSLHIIRETKK